MDKFRIRGGKALRGTVAISGAKNSALPVMAAALLTADKVTLHNIPKVRDLVTMSKLLAFMDAKVSVTEIPSSDYVIEAPKLNHAEAPYELVKTMRASVLTLGPLMARVGVARVSLPGGCAIGARPVEIVNETTMRVRGARKLVGVDMTTEEYPGFATDMQAQYMALATQAEGTSVISEKIFENRFLHASEMMRMGAHISIEGHTATVRGPAELSGTVVQASDLRASAGLVLAGLVANGETLIERVYHIDRGYEGIVEKLRGVGADIERVHGTNS
jgi:UDP-N-acetylglucosamine 1-carboxyvinyltransferase